MTMTEGRAIELLEEFYDEYHGSSNASSDIALSEAVRIAIDNLKKKRQLMDNNKFPEYMMAKLRQRKGLTAYDTSQDDIINQYSNYRVLSELLEWEGIIGYTHVISCWILDLFGIDIENGEQ